MSQEKTPIISLNKVFSTYSDNPLDFKQMVLKDINLEINDGEFVIIFGASGSGKTTLLNIIAGLEDPTSGDIFVRRHNLAHYDNNELAKYHRLKMGLVFQDFNLISSLNVWENVALPQTASGVATGLRRKRAKHLLKTFAIDDTANRHVNELSGGQKQRVAIARALINRPDLLLVDEPTGNLDSKTAEDVMQLFHQLHTKSHRTIVLVTHNADYLHYATRVVHIKDGMITSQKDNEAQPERSFKADSARYYDKIFNAKEHNAHNWYYLDLR